MLREILPAEAPHSPEVMAMVMAMLGDEPIAPALLAKARDPALIEARAKAEAELLAADWSNLGRYQGANAQAIASGARPDLVFMGDSITELWPAADPAFFPPNRLGRGIAGQTSPQMLLRFWPDVIALRPRAVHILAGTNDIAGNTGPTTPYRYQCNIRAMVDLAQAHDIRVLLGSVPPAAGFAFIDYHTPLADGAGAMRPAFTHDGVHPNRRGYAVMRGVLEPHL